MFVNEFNIGFGYPRQDTCSECDRLKAALAQEEVGTPAHAALKTARDIHHMRAQMFYKRKRTSGEIAAQEGSEVAAFAFDYWRNFPVPNVSTNDAYYKRQLSLYTFDVHNLATKQAHLYTYDQTVAKKGANEVVSLLDKVVATIPPEKTKLKDFSVTLWQGKTKNGLCSGK